MRTALLTVRRGPIMPPPPERGYHVVYRGDGSDRCPGCSRQHFHIGRLYAECAFCSTAIPLPETGITGAGTFWRRGGGATR